MFVVEMYTILNLLLLRGCSDLLPLSRIEILSIGEFYLPADHDTTTVWPENSTGIKFDEIASKLHNKNMTDFNLTKCAVRRHIV